MSRGCFSNSIVCHWGSNGAGRAGNVEDEGYVSVGWVRALIVFTWVFGCTCCLVVAFGVPWCDGCMCRSSLFLGWTWLDRSSSWWCMYCMGSCPCGCVIFVEVSGNPVCCCCLYWGVVCCSCWVCWIGGATLNFEWCWSVRPSLWVWAPCMGAWPCVCMCFAGAFRIGEGYARRGTSGSA